MRGWYLHWHAQWRQERRAAAGTLDLIVLRALFTIGLDAPVLAGRGFTPADAVPGSRVAIVDQGFVDQVLQGGNAVGQQVRFPYPGAGLTALDARNPGVPRASISQARRICSIRSTSAPRSFSPLPR